MKKNIKIIIILSVILGLNGCINFKSEYPEITHYRITQEKSEIKRNLKISSSMQIRNVTISEEFDSEHLIAQNPDNTIQRYFYHRWSGDVSYMITDYLVSKLNEYDFFSGGVYKSNSIRIPDYILESQVMELLALNDQEKNGKNSAEISVRFSLLQKENLKTEYKVIFSKQYQISVPRRDFSVGSIVPAFSVGFAQITDKLMKDIIEPIGNMEGKE